MLPLVARTVPLLVILLVGHGRAEVVLASDTKWSLVGNTTTVRRSQLSDFCPPPAGQENEVVILVNPEQFAGVEQATLSFNGAAIILYGAVLTGNPIEDTISITLDDSASQEPAGWPDVIPQSSLDAKSGAACDVVLTKIPNLIPGPYSIGVSTVGSSQRIAIYNATIFARNILPTTTAAQPSSTGSESGGRQADPSASLSSSARDGAYTQPTIRAPGSEGLGASRIAAIVLPSVLVPIILGLLFLWLRRRRRVRSHDAARNSSLQPFLDSSQSPSSPGNPATEKGFLDSKGHDAMSATSYTPSPGSSSLGTEATSMSRYGRARNLSPAITDAAEDAATTDPEQLIAIQRAVRQAGFSTQALLDSLNRVRPAPDPTTIDDTLMSPAPPHYDG
ncbi:hypothetical protein AURDEDRAFT_188028 [Auricularia subglabra TFB-10046 SS5]|uniref:Mid2 domain-containing protein n=1 Tax=Auricularia subglabra (strain TFB-10046 / SS5) TaxID=717982 RepID=J0DAZ1_AURST|nr:hypothetical protein AURDEDRAFT_188028 [Auricularia subglabra TFB-10046 SS5]